jgi:hypothetical protein
MSIENQILSKYTAFVCEEKELIDGVYQEIKDKGQARIDIEIGKFDRYFSHAEESSDSSSSSSRSYSKVRNVEDTSYRGNVDFCNFDSEFTCCVVDYEPEDSV